METLERGFIYKITFIAQSGNMRWYKWEFNAVYVGFARHANYNEAFFSFRPKAGTTPLRADMIMDIKKVRAIESLADPTAADVELPKRLPGAVPGPSALNKRVFEMKP